MSIISGVGAGETVSSSFYDVEIGQSLRFNKADSPRLLDSSVSSSGNRRKFTFSFWIKFGKATELYDIVIGAGGAATYPSALIGFHNQRLSYKDYRHPSYTSDVITTATFRDVSTWYNFVVAVDTEQSTAADRVKMYVNGTQLTEFDTASYPTQNYDTLFQDATSGNEPLIGFTPGFDYMDGYLADIYNVDNAQLAPTEFAETKDGIWIPKQYTGSFGTTGYHLTFSDSSSIGADSSGNNHSFDTVTNLAATDIVLDSPTNNSPTLNPLVYNGNTYSEGALKTSSPTTDWELQVATMFPAGISGKWYAEFYVHTCNASSTRVGVGVTDTNSNPENYLGQTSPDVAYYDINDIYTGGSHTADTDATFAAGDIISVALNLDDGEVTFRKNNSTMSNGTQNLVASTLYTFATTNYGSGSGVVANFGQDDTFAGNKTSGSAGSADDNGIGKFYYAPPSDHLALCASNLSDPTIGPGQDTLATDLFNTILWTGDGTTSRAITGVGFAPDWMWLKCRSNSEDHALEDTVRGVGKKLDSSGTEIEETTATAVLSAHGSDGFTLPSSTPGNLNVNTRTYVAWNWKAGGKADTFNINGTGYSSASDASLSGGDITPTGASINTAAGLSIIAYTGDGTSGARTVKHGLSSPPELIFIKDRETNSNNGQWQASSSVVGDDYGYLSTTAAFTGAALMKPTSGDATTIQLGLGITATTNESGDDFIMYLFHSVEGFSKVGTYAGNSQNYNDGTYVYTGFRPALVVVKTAVTTTSNWVVTDNKRASAFNGDTARLYWDTTSAETAYNTNRNVELFSNGFMVHGNSASSVTNKINENADYVYLAFAEAPFKFANAR